MAELAVLSVACKILSTIASPAFKMAYEKVCSIRGAREELVQLGVTLETISAVLADAEKKDHDSDAIKNWIKRLKGVLYDAEDLVDEVTSDDLRKQQTKKLPLKGQVKAFFSNSHISRNTIAEKVKAIRKSLLGLSTDMVPFQFVVGGQNERLIMRERDSGWGIDAKNVIGRDEDKRIILKMLSDELDRPLVVITVLGIGGMGKTSMAKLVYDDEEIKEKFQKRWFSCISDTSDEREVLRKIFRSICEESCSPDLNVGQLQAKIRKEIEDQKYLLVLDDVWEDKPSSWMDRLSLLSCCAKGSRIIVTTRLPSVNKAMDAVGTHTLEGLSEDDSWNLFKRLAFGAKVEMDPRKERLGREILKKCYGVPLAIKSIGNLLRQEDSLSKWEAIEREGLPKMGGDYACHDRLDLNMRSQITCIVESCISDILPLLPILRSFDEYTSIKLVLAHRLDFSWINCREFNRIDVVEEAQMMPASSLTVLIIQDSKRIFRNYQQNVTLFAIIYVRSRYAPSQASFHLHWRSFTYAYDDPTCRSFKWCHDLNSPMILGPCFVPILSYSHNLLYQCNLVNSILVLVVPLPLQRNLLHQARGVLSTQVLLFHLQFYGDIHQQRV